MFIIAFFFFVLLLFLGPLPVAHGGSQARGPIGAVAGGLRQSHSNSGSELHLQPTPQLMATPNHQPTEQGQGLNPQPHGSQSDLSTTAPRRELHFLFFFKFYLFFCLFCYFLGRSQGIWRFPGWGSNWSRSHQSIPQPEQLGIRAASATYTTAQTTPDP